MWSGVYHTAGEHIAVVATCQDERGVEKNFGGRHQVQQRIPGILAVKVYCLHKLQQLGQNSGAIQALSSKAQKKGKGAPVKKRVALNESNVALKKSRHTYLCTSPAASWECAEAAIVAPELIRTSPRVPDLIAAMRLSNEAPKKSSKSCMPSSELALTYRHGSSPCSEKRCLFCCPPLHIRVPQWTHHRKSPRWSGRWHRK